MFNQQQQQFQQQQLQQQQLLQLQQLLQQSPPQAPLPMAVSRGLPQQQPQQQLLSLQGTHSASLLNGSLLQRALLLQQLQGLDQFAMPSATYDSAGFTMPTATLGNLRGYSMATPNLTASSLTPPQLAPPNLQQFFPQATRQSLLGPPPVGVPINPSQLNLSGRNPQKQTRSPSFNTPNRKDSSSQTLPEEDRADPPEGSEEARESQLDTAADQDPSPCPDTITSEKHTRAPEPEPCKTSEPPAKRTKSSEEPTEKGPPGQPQTRMTVPKQTQTPEFLPEPLEARGMPRFQPRVLQIQTQVQPQMLPVDTQVQPKLHKQAQTQTSPEHLGLQQKQGQPPAQSQPPGQVQPQLQKQVQTQVQPQLQKQAQTQTQPQAQTQTQPQAQTQTQSEAQTQAQPRAQTQAQPREQPSAQVPAQPAEQPQSPPQAQRPGCVPAPEQAPVPGHAVVLEAPPDAVEAGGGTEAASPEPVGAQVSVGASQEEPASGLDMGECEKRAREMLGMWGAGGSLKVTILQSSNSRAFSTVSLTPVSRPGDPTSATPATPGTPSRQAATPGTPSRQALQFFCYICKASCSSQQEFQDHLSEAQHQQRLGEIQHMSQACLLSLLPMPRDVLEREEEEPPPRRWCHTCQVYYVGDLIQHRRTQDHKLPSHLRADYTAEGCGFACSRAGAEPGWLSVDVVGLRWKIAKQSLRPFCTICNRYFKTPRKFVEHVKSQGHKDKAKELKTLEKEMAGQDEDHFITVDAVGCFEGDEEEEDEDEDEEEEIEVDEEFCKQVRSRDISREEWKGSETYSPNTAYGMDFLVPVMGYVCRICHKFYHSNSGAQLSHCKSLAHFENLQKYKAAKNPSPTSRPVSRRCAINARNALTALFTSSGGSGRPPSQLSTQDTAKTTSKCPH
ncbi:cip1-interacting zinc finger protein isoform X2 [Sciurus carolinensis]|uniref:cip1-interacting zinc finger protein isoform X2 n=1 Tax=Sciurus carolinensis TaxID=30640 RepID=UPI001FB1C8D1|nr:cip1-interacting zinc finger protein isoform X2 [Sciurus carolinensis]